MITTKVLISAKEIEDACALLYDVYIDHGRWFFLPDNPSKLRVEVKEERKLLVDRFTESALWFGAFDGNTLIGCARLCGTDENGRFEIEGYASSMPVRKYLTKECLEITKVAVSNDYKGKKVFHRLFLAAFKYCEKHQHSIIACTHNGFLKSLFNKIGFPLKEEHAFKYEEHDPSPINLYLANNAELTEMIIKLKKLQDMDNHGLNMMQMLEIVAPILPTPVYWHDVNGVVLGINEHCLKAIGTTREIIGKTPYEFYPKQIAEHILKHNEQVMRTGEIMTQEEPIEDITTGKVKYFSSTKAPLYDDGGKIIGIVGSSVEITAEKQAAKLQIEIEAYKAEQKAQALFKNLIDEIQYAINTYQVDVLNKQIGSQSPKYDDIEQEIVLTKREEQTLYYLSMHKSPKEIASILSLVEGKEITASTVQSVIDKQLYRKFDVNSIGMLINKAKAFKLIPLALCA